MPGPLIYLRRHYETYPDDESNPKRDDNLIIAPDIGLKILRPLENPEIRKTCFRRTNLFTFFKAMFDYYPVLDEVLPGLRGPSPYREGFTLELTKIGDEESYRILRIFFEEPTLKEKTVYCIRRILKKRDPYFLGQYLEDYNFNFNELQR